MPVYLFQDYMGASVPDVIMIALGFNFFNS